MAHLGEIEIFECLVQSFRQAAEKAEQLAWNPRRGFVYLDFLKDLRAIEGACMQVGQHREDERWWPIGMMMGNVHKFAGKLVRGSRTKDERNKALTFLRELADHLRALQYEAEELRTKRTGRIGMILPEPQEGPYRDTRPVAVPQIYSRLILPGDPRYAG